MSENFTKQIRDESMRMFKPFAEKMLKEGADKRSVVAAYNAWLTRQRNDFYANEHKPKKVNTIFDTVLEDLKGHTADSKVEKIVYDILKENKIGFKFQYKIGPYRADFLVGDDLVVEIDGPMHDPEKDKKRDAYLKKRGYRVFRVPTIILFHAPKAVVEEIKKRLTGVNHRKG